MAERPDTTTCRTRPRLLRVCFGNRLRRRSRWCLRGLLLLPLVIFFVLVILTQTFVLRSLLVPELEAALNVEVRTSRVHVTSDGSIVMHDVRVRVPRVDGDPGEFLRVRRLRAWVDWPSLVRGQPAIRRLRPVGAVARFSQNVDDWSLNVESLRLSRGGGRGSLPRIDPTWVLVDLGEHSGSPPHRYTPLRLLKLNAAISPDTGGYTVVLKERADGGSMALTARIDASGINASLTGMRLDAWRASSLPSPIRPFFASLGLSGGVSEVSFAYTDAGVEAIMQLQGVAMNVPEVHRHDDPSDAPLRMSDVYGTIRIRDDAGVVGVTADFAGLLEDMPYEVRLRWHGLSLDSGFDVEFATRGFELDDNPRLLPFAPALARYRFESFSRPTATVDAFITVSRDAPVNGATSEVRQIGRIYFRDCSAAYDRFPYPFHDMTGEIEFDGDELRINSITGTSPTGAKVRVHGRVSPLDRTAEVELWIDVDDVPIDEQLAQGLGPDRADILTELFNEPAFAALIEAGLVHDPRRRDDLHAAMADASTANDPVRVARHANSLAAPPFAIGGLVNLRLHLHRRLGEQAHWDQRIRVIMPAVGLLARRFPFPVVGRDVVLDIGDHEATLSGGEWRTTSGEAATITAHIVLHDAAGEPDFNPRIDIVANDITISDLLIEALPAGDDAQQARREGSGPTVRDIARVLRPTGMGSARASIVQRDDGELGFDVQIHLANATIAPQPPPPTQPAAAGSDAEDTAMLWGLGAESRGMVLRDVRGDIVVSEKHARIDLLGTQDLTPVGGDTIGEPAVGGQVRITAEASFDQDSLSYSCELDGSHIHLNVRAEDAVRAFSPEFAEEVAAARRELQPRGSVDGTLKVWSERDDTRARLEVSRARELSFNILGGRMEVRESSGSMMFALDRGETATFEAVRASVLFDDQPAGEVALHGTISLAALRDGHTFDLPPTNLAVRVSDARLESSIAQRLIERHAPADLAQWWRSAGPGGDFEHELIVTSPSTGDGPLVASATIKPLNIEFTHEGERIRIVEAFGDIRTSPDGGAFNFDLLRGHGWSARTSGRWALHAEGGVSIRTTLAADAAGIPPDFMALLPRGLRESIAKLEFHTTGIISLDDAHVAYSTFGDGEWSAAANGTIDATDFALRAGLNFTNASALAKFDLAREIGAPDGTFELHVTAPTITADGVSLTDLRATIVGTQTPDELIIPLLTAASHGGRISGLAHVRPLGESSEYLVEAMLADVAFGPLVTELRTAMNPTDARGVAPEGLLSGRLSLSGVIGDDSARRGTAVFVVGGGEVLKMPLALPLIEASNLALPLGAELDTARAELFIEGDMISFEELSLVSPAVWIWGFGRMAWSTKEIDLRFKSRAANRFPILSDLIEGIRNQLMSVRVRGKLGQHQVTLEQLPGPFRMVGRVLGRQGSERQRRLDELEARFDWGRWGAAPGTITDDTIAARRAEVKESK